MEKKDNTVVIIGLGYVGLTLAAHMADCGFSVHGVEIKEEVLEPLRSGKAFFHEEGLDSLLKKVVGRGSLTFSKSIPLSRENRVFIITVGTPLNTDGFANLDYIERVSKDVASHLQPGDFVILRSTVKLGTTSNVVCPLLDAAKFKYGIAFCPERTLEGAALRELSSLPQIIGTSNDIDKARANEIFTRITSSVVHVSSLETAELVKLIDNMQRDVHFAISNEVAKIGNVFEIDASEVIAAGKLGYSRTNLAMPGPVGGPCLEKDTYLLNESLGWSNSLSLAARKTNESIIEDSIEFLLSAMENFSGISSRDSNFGIGLLGLAFKGIPETDDLRGSLGITLLNELKLKFQHSSFAYFDPLVNQYDERIALVDRMDSIENVFEKSRLVVITNNHPSFAHLDLDALSAVMPKRSIVYDLWGRYSAAVDGNGNLRCSWGSLGKARKIVR
jgi:UDP-N-acetyl-D-mannosaminuronic acid dehydrogenase